ncbi:hypothetical protein GQ600_15204 [Phytophthora cactorum]|nr:hypothetical protein GQ600_15204 [Phytophthora cactorum]
MRRCLLDSKPVGWALVREKFTTGPSNTISAGNPTKNIGNNAAPEGYQLGGFFGTSDKELDSVVAIWTSIES